MSAVAENQVVTMVAPSIEHGRIVGQLVHLLRVHNESACVVPGAVKVWAENETLIPDVTVICGEAQRSAIDKHAIVNPVIVFEVRSTASQHRGTKLHLYRRIPSLREYVLVAQDRRFISVCRRVGDLWAFVDVEAGGVLKLEALGVELPVDAIYSDPSGEIVP